MYLTTNYQLIHVKKLPFPFKPKKEKRPNGLNGHLSIRDSTLTSCQKGSYLHINRTIIEQIKITMAEEYSIIAPLNAISINEQ